MFLNNNKELNDGRINLLYLQSLICNVFNETLWYRLNYYSNLTDNIQVPRLNNLHRMLALYDSIQRNIPYVLWLGASLPPTPYTTPSNQPGTREFQSCNRLLRQNGSPLRVRIVLARLRRTYKPIPDWSHLSSVISLHPKACLVSRGTSVDKYYLISPTKITSLSISTNYHLVCTTVACSHPCHWPINVVALGWMKIVLCSV